MFQFLNVKALNLLQGVLIFKPISVGGILFQIYRFN